MFQILWLNEWLILSQNSWWLVTHLYAKKNSHVIELFKIWILDVDDKRELKSLSILRNTKVSCIFLHNSIRNIIQFVYYYLLVFIKQCMYYIRIENMGKMGRFIIKNYFEAVPGKNACTAQRRKYTFQPIFPWKL